MDDKHMDKLLKGLKEDYERLPPFSEEGKIIPQMASEKERRRRGKLFSYVALIAGLLIFLVLALPVIKEYEQADMTQNQLVDYYEEKKEEFQNELGMESLDRYWEVAGGENLLDYLEQEFSGEDIENVKNNIDELFVTPRQVIEQINSGERELSEENVGLLLDRMSSLSDLLDSSFKSLRIEHQLSMAELEEIYLNPAYYQGQAEIVEFIELLHREGFQIIESGFKHQSRFQIRPDYYAVVERLDDWQEFEGVAAYLTFVEDKFDVYYPGIDNMHGTPWYEFDEILLELETIYEAYPESRNLIFKSPFFSGLFAADWYLTDYLAGNAADELWEDIQGKLEEELTAFVDEHPDSLYTPIVADALETYEETNWQPYSYTSSNELYILFELKDGNIQFDQRIDVNRWPISTNTLNNYKQYEETNDITLLSNYSSFEFLSLYMLCVRE